MQGAPPSMSRPDFSAHPVSLVPRWSAALDSGWDAHFSRYRYSPQSVEDRRILFKVPLNLVTAEWLERQLVQLSSDEELAIHSKITKERKVRHIPMIDFAVARDEIVKLTEWSQEYLDIQFQLFASGRSFHAYGTRPVTTAEWRRLMGLLLLGNLPNRAPVVDSRWIGHRLMAGYSALRWSKNTGHYEGWPVRAGN